MYDINFGIALIERGVKWSRSRTSVFYDWFCINQGVSVFKEGLIRKLIVCSKSRDRIRIYREGWQGHRSILTGGHCKGGRVRSWGGFEGGTVRGLGG